LFRSELVVLLFASIIFLGGVLSPPSLMDDMDAAQAQIARNMIESGNWITMRLDGVLYLEKAPLKYWLIAGSFAIFGVHDWAARLPIALAAIALCWVVARMGAWAFSERAGFYAGLMLATSAGLFLFTRVMIPDVMLTLAIALAIWSFLRALDEEEPRPGLWAIVLAASLAAGVLVKGLVGIVLPAGGAFFYLALTRRVFDLRSWRRLRPASGLLIFLAIAAPWHVLATLQNQPYFDFTLQSEPGQYRGFFWFYFINEHVLRFLGRRYPRDYNTVPLFQFWLLHLVWLFPWSVLLPWAARLGFRPADRAGRTRLLALCWTGFVLLFFSLSTSQEYYSMPVYPALALLLGSAAAAFPRRAESGIRVVGVVAAIALAAILAILFLVRDVEARGDISGALQQNPDAYTLSLGHMQDLTLESFAWLRVPLIVAAGACVVGVIGGWKRSLVALAVMMVVFLHAARLALVVFDPYLSSRPLAEALNRSPGGTLIFDGPYYTFSSVVFYANRNALLVNGRVNNLEYGSYAPGAPPVFLDDAGLARLWSSPGRRYLAAENRALPRLEALLGRESLHRMVESGGKSLFSNRR
jgi:4-amino-4-deoxy-L-arabinose transferase-like glycosyltransferase